METSTAIFDRAGRLLRSPLAKAILLSFFCIALVESLFLLSLSTQIFEADQKAEREYRLLKIAKDLSETVQGAILAYGELDMVRKSPRDQQHISLFRISINNVYHQLDTLKNDMSMVHLNTSSTDQTKDCFKRISDVVENIILNAEHDPAYTVDYMTVRNQVVVILLELMQHVDEMFALTKKLVFQPYHGANIMTLLYLAVFVNTVMIFILAAMAEHGIARPIRLLARDCSRISSAELMNKPRVIKNEIGELELSFYRLSKKIQETEQRRHSNLELLQTMQTAALERVSRSFETLKGLPQASEKALRKFAASLSSLSSLKELLNSMTASLQHGNSSVHVQISDTNSTQLIEAALSATESLISKNKIVLQRNEEGSYSLEADEQLIVRVLINYISNAIKYSNEGSTIEINVSLSQNGHRRFEVVDSGPGIKKEDLEKLFGRFQMLEASDGIKRQGTGLGLAICKEIVERHGGQVGCISEVGKGSCFWFDLPEKIPAYLNAENKHNPTVQTSNESPGENKSQKQVQAIQVQSKRIGSLKRDFGLMLLIFLIPQILLAVNFHSKFHQVNKAATEYAKQKDFLFRVEEVYFLFLNWRNSIALSVDKENFTQLADIFKRYKTVMQKTVYLVKTTEKDTPRYQALLAVLSGEKKILEVLKFVAAHPEQLSSYTKTQLKSSRKDMSQLDDDLSGIMDKESRTLKSQYALSNKLRDEILISLAGAGLLNILVLTAVGIMGLRTIEKIANLQAKSLRFASGETIDKTIAGNDELAYLDERLVEVCKTIHDAQKEQQVLMSVINHDLRTPLSSILSVLELTSSGVYVQLDEENTAMVSSAQKDVRRLLGRVSDLLTLEKIDAGAYEIQQEETNLVALLEKATKEEEENATAKSATFVITTSSETSSEASKGFNLLADKSLLERAIAIVLNNAVNAVPTDATEPVNGRGQININLKESKTSNQIVIQDRGIGVDPQLLPQIFERFRVYDGKPLSGLGLALAFRILKLHNGEISLQSSSQTGTSVCITLPRNA